MYTVLGWLCVGFVAFGCFATAAWMLASINSYGGFAIIMAFVALLVGGFSIFGGIVCFGPDKKESYDY